VWQAGGTTRFGLAVGRLMAAAPAATAQQELDRAIALCDRVLVEAQRRGVRVSVAVCDAGGDPIQQDRMDGAVAGGVDVALATAAAAGEGLRRADVVLGPPVPDPDKILCIGLNYTAHAEETNLDPSAVPTV